MWYFLPICLLLLPLFGQMGVMADCTEGKIAECQRNTDNTNSTLRFTDTNPQLKINVPKDRYMTPSMSCQAEGFHHIKWIKDDRWTFPFNFTYGSTRCHVSLKDCNQTIEITNTQKDAIGNYTCTVSNDEHTIRRTFEVNVLDPNFTIDPYAISHPNCSDLQLKPGQDVSLFCEFCAGTMAQVTELRWHKRDRDGNLVPIAQLADGGSEEESQYWESSNIFTRGCFETYNRPAAVGRTLKIRDVTSDELGIYVLTANYTLNGVIKAGSHEVSLTLAPDRMIQITVGVVVSLAAIFFVVTMVAVTCYNHHLTLQLYWKNRFGKVEEHDGMEYDAFVSFSDSSEDGTFAIGVAQLLLQQNYNVWMRDMHSIPGEALIAEEIVSMKQSRRCILIISPDYPTSSHSQILTDLAADQTLRKRSRIIPILYRDVTKEHLKQHRRLAEIVRVCPCITWKEMIDGSSSDMPIGSISGSGSADTPSNCISGCGSSNMPSNSISVCGSSEMPSNNISGCGSLDTPSNSTSGCGNGEMPSNGIGSCSDKRRGRGDVGHNETDIRINEGSGDEHFDLQPTSINHDDESTTFDLSNRNMRMMQRVGDEEKLIEEQDEQKEQKKRKNKKQREKFEKRLLLTMPPKRLITGSDSHAASMVV